MGWFWNSSPTSPEPGSSSGSSTQAPTAPTQPVDTAPIQAQHTESATDREMAVFMQMLQKDAQASNTPQPETQQQSPQPPAASSAKADSWFSWGRPRSADDPTPSASEQTRPTTTRIRTRTPESLAMSEHLLPTTMSCRDAFDYAWYCHTPGSQWNAVYRYGSVRTCSELWDDFWFCMRTKSYSPEMRAEVIKAHYRAKEEAKYGGGKPSSEDVWESREERVPPGTAFQAKFEPPIMDDAEFQRMDAERRRRIREMMGIEQGNENKEDKK
ncbi:uncharacterized protein B0T15DRAFT_535133 [Chaetomium strumarium]|uniref:Early meiotic induction protein 1 n=1 Tax=Chaetomium strumarium TaxID=1170767 RepID=A0AAJ0M012_9PEZI|nr:hypothetical protein B0T15DRAFT_535133 [Chaetomium strumarium]